jgi:hypothetical protein
LVKILSKGILLLVGDLEKGRREKRSRPWRRWAGVGRGLGF